MTVIAMTREIGCRGTEVAEGLARELGLSIIDSEIITTDVAGRLGIEEHALQRHVAGTASMFERWTINRRKLQRYTAEEILQRAQQGNVIIRGWGAATLLRDFPQVISVRACAPKASRVQLMIERLGEPDVAAVSAEIERYDAAYAGTLRAFFNIAQEDTLLYHISLNTDRVPVEACVKAVCQLATDPKFRDHEKVKSALANKLLETKVNAALAEQISIALAPTGISASADNGNVRLVGTATSGSVPTKAEEIVGLIDGVRKIDNRINVVPPRGGRF